MTILFANLRSMETSDKNYSAKISSKKIRQGWEEQLSLAITNGELPDDELLEGFEDIDVTSHWFKS